MSYRDDALRLPNGMSVAMIKAGAAGIAARADARIAELERECAQWRDELRIYRETEDARIAELVDLLTECRDCVASDINHTLAQFHEPAAVDYLHALLMRVDAAMAARANGGEG